MTEKMDMREAMPVTAAWIDQMREVFGVNEVHRAVLRGMRGGVGFHATENGYEMGTPMPRGVRIGWNERGNMVNLDDPDAQPEPYGRRGKPVAWQGALDEQEREQAAIDKSKGT